MSRPDSTMAVDTKQSGLAVHELDHHRFQIALAHLPVAMSTLASGHRILDEGGHVKAATARGLCTKKTWPPRGELPLDGVLDRWCVEAGDDGLDGQTVDGGRLDDGEVAHARERHVERARNGGGGESERIHAGAQLLDPLLVTTPKRCSSSTTRRPRLRKVTSFDTQAVRPMTTSPPPYEGLRPTGLLPFALRKREKQLHPRGKGGEAVAEGVEVLLREHGRRHQDGHLAAVATALKAARSATSVLP